MRIVKKYELALRKIRTARVQQNKIMKVMYAENSLLRNQPSVHKTQMQLGHFLISI